MSDYNSSDLYLNETIYWARGLLLGASLAIGSVFIMGSLMW